MRKIAKDDRNWSTTTLYWTLPCIYTPVDIFISNVLVSWKAPREHEWDHCRTVVPETGTLNSRYIAGPYNTILYTAHLLRMQNFGQTSNSRQTHISRPNGRVMGVFRKLFGEKVPRYIEIVMHQGQGQVITSHSYGGISLLAPTLDTCFWRNTHDLCVRLTVQLPTPSCIYSTHTGLAQHIIHNYSLAQWCRVINNYITDYKWDITFYVRYQCF